MTHISLLECTCNIPPSCVKLEKNPRKEKYNALAISCPTIFERLLAELIETNYNLHIAIYSQTQHYLLDSTFLGITQKIWEVYGKAAEVKLTIFRLKNTGTYSRQWV